MAGLCLEQGADERQKALSDLFGIVLPGQGARLDHILAIASVAARGPEALGNVPGDADECCGQPFDIPRGHEMGQPSPHKGHVGIVVGDDLAAGQKGLDDGHAKTLVVGGQDEDVGCRQQPLLFGLAGILVQAGGEPLAEAGHLVAQERAQAFQQRRIRIRGVADETHLQAEAGFAPERQPQRGQQIQETFGRHKPADKKQTQTPVPGARLGGIARVRSGHCQGQHRGRGVDATATQKIEIIPAAAQDLVSQAHVGHLAQRGFDGRDLTRWHELFGRDVVKDDNLAHGCPAQEDGVEQFENDAEVENGHLAGVEVAVQGEGRTGVDGLERQLGKVAGVRIEPDVMAALQQPEDFVAHCGGNGIVSHAGAADVGYLHVGLQGVLAERFPCGTPGSRAAALSLRKTRFCRSVKTARSSRVAAAKLPTGCPLDCGPSRGVSTFGLRSALGRRPIQFAA